LEGRLQAHDFGRVEWTGWFHGIGGFAGEGVMPPNARSPAPVGQSSYIGYVDMLVTWEGMQISGLVVKKRYYVNNAITKEYP
jgi:hypothetical protein